MVQADDLVMLEGFKVTARVTRDMVEQVRLFVLAKESACENFVFMISARPDCFFCDQVGYITGPMKNEGFA